MEYVMTDYDGCEYITAGKRYDFERREGELCNITDDQGDGILILVRGSCAHLNGHAWTVHTHTEGKTMAELDVKAGDVVECVKWNGDYWTNNREYKIQENNKIQNNTGSEYNISSVGRMGLWRIVSRATPQPTLWRDMTDAEKGALLLAKHEGKAIECRIGLLDWVSSDPTWADEWSYRINHTPKTTDITISGKTNVNGHFIFDEYPHHSDTHRITFTTTDGKPDTASIRMEEL